MIEINTTYQKIGEFNLFTDKGLWRFMRFWTHIPEILDSYVRYYKSPGGSEDSGLCTSVTIFTTIYDHLCHICILILYIEILNMRIFDAEYRILRYVFS
jgi:hypothetical protein